MTNISLTDQPVISILGTGFAALTAIKNVRKHLPQAVIHVIAPKAHLVYLPSIIWIPAGIRTTQDCIVPLNRFFERQNVHFICANVLDVQNQGRLVLTDQGNYENDGLIIATGGRFLKKLPGIEHALTPCEGVAVAEKIKQALDTMQGGTIAIGFGANPKEPSAMRGGPMFEFLLGIDTLLRRQKRRHQFELVFFNAAPEPGKRLGEKVPAALLSRMDKLGIKTLLGQKPVGFSEQQVQFEQSTLQADLILFMPGTTGPAWLSNNDGSVPLSEGGLIRANDFAQVDGWQRTYVAGDAGSYPGPDWQPKQAHAADIQAKTAAINLVKELQGKPPQQKIVHELMCIVDSLSHGIFIKRTEAGTTLLPPLRLFHWAKRFFEWWYLRQYR